MHVNDKILLLIKRQGQLKAPGDYIRGAIIAFLLTCGFVMFFCITGPVSGQETQTIQVQPPDIEDFPFLTFQIKPSNTIAFDGDGLNQDQIQVFEDERQVEVISLDQTYVGVHFTLAINGSTFFDLNDQDGISPYDRIRDTLEEWVSSREFSNRDSWSLSTNEGLILRNTSSAEVWRLSFTGYEPNLRNSVSNLESLSKAIENARDRVVPFGVDKSILYVTTAPMASQIEALNALSMEAQLAGIRISVWMVEDAYYLTNDQGGSLINLAKNTGGSFFNYTGVEPLPDPETILSSLGSFYSINYETSIRATGTYPLRVQINLPEGEISGESVPFYIEVESPNPLLLSPPSTIERHFEQVAGRSDQDLYPDLENINILIEFPDGHPREITTSRLIVDGRIVLVKDQPPFDVLTWDISSLEESGEHILQVEVSDNLGLSGWTIKTPVQILIIEPEPESHHLVNRPWMIVLAGVGVIIFIFAIFWILRRVWLKNQINKFKQFLRKQALSNKRSDRQGPDAHLRGEAMLHPLLIEKGFDPSQSIPITQSKIVLGSDPKTADIVLTDPSIAAIHAQLHYNQGQYWLKDLDETRGTWLNYRLLHREPVSLQPGDIIHIGDVGFRYTIIDAEHPPEVTVSKYKPTI